MAFVVSLFCIGLGVSDLIKSNNETQLFVTKDLFMFIPYVISGGIFFYILYIKKENSNI